RKPQPSTDLDLTERCTAREAAKQHSLKLIVDEVRLLLRRALQQRRPEAQKFPEVGLRFRLKQVPVGRVVVVLRVAARRVNCWLVASGERDFQWQVVRKQRSLLIRHCVLKEKRVRGDGQVKERAGVALEVGFAAGTV